LGTLSDLNLRVLWRALKVNESVTELNLSSNRISSLTIDAISSLSQRITRLDLSNNSLVTLPSKEMAKFTCLEWLNLKGNDRLTALPFEIPSSSISNTDSRFRLNCEFYRKSIASSSNRTLEELFELMKCATYLEEARNPLVSKETDSSSCYRLMYETTLKLIPILELFPIRIITLVMNLVTEGEGIY